MEINLKSQAILLILSSSSGGGKTSLAKALIAKDQNIQLSISATTRAPRETEQDERDYYFYSSEKFEQLRIAGKFLEYTKIYDSYYGTLISTIEQSISQEKDVIFDIDWHGNSAIKKMFPARAVSVFIMPPNQEILKQRLFLRDNNKNNSSVNRLSYAKTEIQNAVDYDYIIVNNDFETAVNNLQAIIVAERARKTRMNNLEEFINSF